MKRVILVSYHFPPCGGKAVQRASKLTKYLPRFGWEPVVFTMPLKERGVPIDRTLLDELPPGIEISRPSFTNWWKLIPHDIRKYVYHPIPDRYITWVKAVETRLIALVEKTGAQALISTSPTHSAHFLGLAAKEKTGIPWIADFRDPWTGHPDFPSKKHADIMCEMETGIIETADAVIGVYPKILRDFENRVSSDKLFLLENGYDEDDFTMIDRSKRPEHDALRMGYNGTVSDFHNPEPLLRSLENLLNNGRLDPEKLRVVFTTNERGKKRFAPFKTLLSTGVLRIRDYLPHTESLALLAEMDISLLLVTRGRNIYPGKVFEYFYLGNPILSLSSPGDDLGTLIQNTGSGIVVDYRDEEKIENTVLELIEKKRQGELSRFSPHRDKISRFSRKRIAERYAGILDSISGT
ncbi:hypothetical protein ACFL1R_11050 [Candidatus Latescibacterota bacterium]